jgi:hypothetical protein
VCAAAFPVVEPVFGCRGIARHSFALGVGEGMGLHAFQGEGGSPAVERRRQGADQPVFQHPEAANTPFIEIVPVIHQSLEIHLERDMLQQTAQSALERDLIRLLLELIPRNMEICPRRAVCPERLRKSKRS